MWEVRGVVPCRLQPLALCVGPGALGWAGLQRRAGRVSSCTTIETISNSWCHVQSQASIVDDLGAQASCCPTCLTSCNLPRSHAKQAPSTLAASCSCIERRLGIRCGRMLACGSTGDVCAAPLERGRAQSSARATQARARRTAGRTSCSAVMMSDTCVTSASAAMVPLYAPGTRGDSRCSEIARAVLQAQRYMLLESFAAHMLHPGTAARILVKPRSREGA